MPKKSAPKKFIKKDYRKITVSLPQPISKEGVRSFFTKEGGKINKSSFAFLGQEFTHLTLVFLSLCLIFLMVVAGWFYLNFEQARQRYLAAQDNFLYWQEVAEKQVNSPDAYYQAAVYAVELGNNQKAYEDLKKALDLDPQFKKASELQKALINSRE